MVHIDQGTHPIDSAHTCHNPKSAVSLQQALCTCTSLMPAPLLLCMVSSGRESQAHSLNTGLAQHSNTQLLEAYVDIKSRRHGQGMPWYMRAADNAFRAWPPKTP
jgi:hypothetical protein